MNHAWIKTTQLFIENDLQYFSIPADDVDIRESFSNSEELSGHLLNGGRYNKKYFAQLQLLEYQIVRVGGQICSMGEVFWPTRLWLAFVLVDRWTDETSQVDMWPPKLAQAKYYKPSRLFTSLASITTDFFNIMIFQSCLNIPQNVPHQYCLILDRPKHIIHHTVWWRPFSLYTLTIWLNW